MAEDNPEKSVKTFTEVTGYRGAVLKFMYAPGGMVMAILIDGAGRMHHIPVAASEADKLVPLLNKLVTAEIAVTPTAKDGAVTIDFRSAIEPFDATKHGAPLDCQVMELSDFQDRLRARKLQTFANKAAIFSPASRALNVCEEAGEMAREERRAIDGEKVDEALARDAVGDILVALTGYCIARGWAMEEVLAETWAELDARWAKGQTTGTPPSQRGGQS